MELINAKQDNKTKDVEQPIWLKNIDTSKLSAVARQYLEELEHSLSPTQAYTILYPNGYEYGNSGLSPEYPALSISGALRALGEIFIEKLIQTEAECRRYKITPVPNPYGMLKEFYVVDANAKISLLRLS